MMMKENMTKQSKQYHQPRIAPKMPYWTLYIAISKSPINPPINPIEIQKLF